MLSKPNDQMNFLDSWFLLNWLILKNFYLLHFPSQWPGFYLTCPWLLWLMNCLYFACTVLMSCANTQTLFALSAFSNAFLRVKLYVRYLQNKNTLKPCRLWSLFFNWDCLIFLSTKSYTIQIIWKFELRVAMSRLFFLVYISINAQTKITYFFCLCPLVGAWLVEYLVCSIFLL